MLRRIDGVIVRVNEIVLIVFLVVMAAVVFANVAGRAATGQSFGWGDELARQLLVWLVMLSVGLGLRRGGHLALTLAFTMTPPGVARGLKRLVLVCIIAFAGYAAWAGYGYMDLGRYQSSPVMGVPYAYIYASIPIGFALLIYHAIASWRRFVASTDEFESFESSGASW